MQLSFNVYGIPAAQGSKRHVGNGVMVESSKKVKPWRQDVKAAALEAHQNHPDVPIFSDAVIVHATFHFSRPKSHYRTGKNADVLRDSAPQCFVAKKPDIEKVLRSTFDAITEAGVWRDDSLVVKVVSAKFYADDRPPGAEVRILSVPA